jgi:hypothetical protein
MTARLIQKLQTPKAITVVGDQEPWSSAKRPAQEQGAKRSRPKEANNNEEQRSEC